VIGWYVHHHGSGHEVRACTVVPLLADEVVCFSSRPLDIPTASVRRLPLDVEPPTTAWHAAQPTPTALHYAPLGVAGLRRRMGMMAAWMAESDPAAMVVDVSVEVTLLARLLSIPSIVVRQHGRRTDPPHRTAVDAASLLLAPYPEWLEEPWVPDAMRDRTVYTGGFSRFDHRDADRDAARSALGLDADVQMVVVLPGQGGRVGWPVHEAAAATGSWQWVVLGDMPAGPHVTTPGWVEDPWPWLAAADVIVSHGGHNAIMESIGSGRPVIIVPQDRPFDEQRHKAHLLAAHDVCLVRETWPRAAAWPALLDRAVDHGAPRAADLVDGKGAHRAADAIQSFIRTSRGATP